MQTAEEHPRVKYRRILKFTLMYRQDQSRAEPGQCKAFQNDSRWGRRSTSCVQASGVCLCMNRIVSAMLSGEIRVSLARFRLPRPKFRGINLAVNNHVDNVNSFGVKLARQGLIEHRNDALAIASGANPARSRSAAVAPVGGIKPYPALSRSGITL
jgi:hypothetical protein